MWYSQGKTRNVCIFCNGNATACGTHIYKKRCVCKISEKFFMMVKNQMKMMRVYNYTAKYVSVIQKNKKILHVVIWKPKVKSKYISPISPSFGQLLLSCFSAFAPVASNKNKGVVGNSIIFLLDPFYSPRGWFCVFFYKKRRRKRVFGRNVAWFWACNLLNEGVLKLCLENTCCKLVKMNFRWEILLS